ncbi:YD repeat-containing protein, partial [Rhodanobacter sp. OK091]
MRSNWQGICLSAAVLLFSFGPLCHAQSMPEQAYKQLIRVNEDIQPLGEHPFGENISLYDGSLSFTQTDISLAGTGPLLQLVRQFDAEGDRPSASDVDTVFGDWKLILPHLETLTAGVPPSPSNPTGLPMANYNPYTNLPQKIYGWEVDNFVAPGIDLNARCTHFGVPPTVFRHLGDPGLQEWDPEEWWRGYHLVLPGESSQDMLSNVDAATKGTYPAVTKSHWRFSCLPTTSNGLPGEAFLGQAPDGTLYWFDKLVYRGATGMTRQLFDTTASVDSHPSSSLVAFANKSVETLISVLSGSTVARAQPITDSITESLGVLLVTKIQDRFGNTLNYSYDVNGYLTGITASDGRALNVTYVSGTQLIQSVTLQPSSGAARTWTYAYSAGALPSLTTVTLPDGTQWHYNLAGFDTATLAASSPFSSCITLAVPAYLGPTTGTIVHPSGLTGTFVVAAMKHGRSYVRQGCGGVQYNDPNTGGSYAIVPDAWYSLTATQMTVSGAGIPNQTWSYNYSPANESWSNCTGTCPTTIWSDIVAPDGSAVRHIFSNLFGMTESQLLRTEYYAGAAGASTLLRAEDNAYAPPTTVPLPTIVGENLQPLINADQSEKYSPLNQRVITQDGDTYTWQAEAFDVYAQVTQTKRSNSIAGQSPIEEATTYLNDTNLWVLGLPQQVTNLTTGEVESLNTYNTSNDTLLSRARFGQPLMSYTFNTAGQLASFTDGNNHTTSLSNYKRGIPQTIGYPDGTSESLTVDDFGQISAITDQAGHTTSYGYDSIGRITGITYPGGDEVAWLSKTFAYDFVTSDERGVSANHWRRTTTTGNAVGVTYFDAMLRPVLSDSAIGASVQASTLTTYDAKGQKTFSAYPSASALNFTLSPAAAGIKGVATTYDALERVTQTQQDSELGTLTASTAYLSGARQQVTDPKSNVTTTSYQVFDSPSYSAPIQVQAPAGITQAIARDLYGNPLSITQSGLYGTENDSVTKTLTYDAYHRL